MKSRSALKAVGTVLFVVLAFAIGVFADDVPTFRDPDVNEHVKKWSPFIRDFAANYEAMEAGKSATMDLGLFSRLRELQKEALEVTRKLEPDEKQKFHDFSESAWTKFPKLTRRLRGGS